MMNKKLLAATIAATLSTSAFAAQDLDDATTEAVVFASELITPAADVVVDNANAVDLDVASSIGFSIADGTSKYVRYELTNAVFETALVAGDFTANDGALVPAPVAAAGFAISQGGAQGDDYVVIEVSAVGADLQQTDVIVLSAADYNISQSGTATIASSLHDTAVNAVNGANALHSASGPLAVVTSITSGTFTVEMESVATVDSEFKAFDFGVGAEGDAISATLGLVGMIDTSEYLTGAGFQTDGSAVVAGDLIADAQDVSLTGDFSFGAWHLDTNVNCNTADAAGSTALNMVANAEEDGIDAIPLTAVNTAAYLCVTVLGVDVIEKGSYGVSLDDDELMNSLGKISYDTTSIEVPYLTTFNAYNQRLYITNYSATDAVYSISFVSEAAVTATAGAKASGTIPAGEMLMIKATDVVSLAGGSRTSAIIEVEAHDDDVSAASQAVNLSNGGTDTVILN